MGNVSIDLSLANLWRSWQLFRRGKKSSSDIDQFAYNLESNLLRLWQDLDDGSYRHGGYRKFIVADNKRREISVASVCDRVVHRLLYEYLVKIYDKTFIYDAWSCRKGKGVVGAINRTQNFLLCFKNSFVWRSDIVKFFDNVDTGLLFEILCRKIKEDKALRLLKEVIESFLVQGPAGMQRERERESKGPRRGIPIGNLTSQIFANIYLNEFDRFVKHQLKPQAYLRYGDDFIIINDTKVKVNQVRLEAIKFLFENLKMQTHQKSDIIVACRQGLKFLGTEIFSNGRRLKKRNWHRAISRLNHHNLGSYWGLIKQHNFKKIKQFNWIVKNYLYEDTRRL